MDIQHILLIDDDEVSNFINREYLRSSGLKAEISVHSSAEDALEYMEAERSTFDKHAFQVVLVDINMPGLDGFEFVEMLRAKQLAAQIKVYMLTTSAHPRDLQRARELAVDGYITKPLNLEKLNKLLAAEHGKPWDEPW
jgi:CheY-like chemotaxis protein